MKTGKGDPIKVSCEFHFGPHQSTITHNSHKYGIHRHSMLKSSLSKQSSHKRQSRLIAEKMTFSRNMEGGKKKEQKKQKKKKKWREFKDKYLGKQINK